MPETTPRLALPYPVPDDSVDVPRDIEALATKLDTMSTVPVGALLLWATAVAPAGFLVCDGAVVPAATYPALAAVLGSAGGNITLPDLSDRFPVGANTGGGGAAIGSIGGANSVTLTGPQSGVQSHDHNVGGGGNVPSTSGSGGVWAIGGVTYGSGSYTNAFILHGAGTFSIARTTGLAAAKNATAAHENRPAYLAVHFIIRAI